MSGNILPTIHTNGIVDDGSNFLIGNGPLTAPLGVGMKVYKNRGELASDFRHATNAVSHAADDLLLKLNPNATIWDRAGTSVSHGIDNAKVAAQDAYDWAELNPGKAAGIALGVPVALAGSYYLYKKLKDRQNGGR